MTNVTQILAKIEKGDSTAAAQLLTLMYDELRKLAAAKLANEKPGQTLQATALVHEAYLRLVDQPGGDHWDGRRHFFAAAAEAMRRILVEAARRKRRLKYGGDLERNEVDVTHLVVQADDTEIVAVHEALDELAIEDAQAAQLVKLHYFTGMTIDDAAKVLGVSSRTAYRDWAFARSWLKRRLKGGDTLLR